MRTGMDNQKAAVLCGHWPLCRFDPALAKEGKNPLRLDSQPPKIRFEEYSSQEARYKMLEKSHPAIAKKLAGLAQEDVNARWRMYEQLASLQYVSSNPETAKAEA